MKPKLAVLFLTGLITGLSFLSLAAQPLKSVRLVPEKEREFTAAMSKYVSGNYRSAFVAFELLSNSKIIHHRMTLAWLMAGKSLYQLERYADAIPYFTKLSDVFPRSKYVDDAEFFLAASHYQRGADFKAAKSFLWLLDWSREKELLVQSRRMANYLIRHKLSLSESQNLLRYANRKTSAAIVTIGLAKKELAEGSSERVKNLLKNYEDKFGRNEYSGQFDQLLADSKGAGKRPVKVGVILPLTGFFSEVGLGILRGIKFAQIQAADQTDPPIQIIVRDSESNMIKAIQATQYLLKGEKVKAIIGELESDITAGIGALASIDEVPVLGPAATENEVAATGRSIYQLNSDLERKGQALAEYAFNQLGLRTFASLAPADEYGQQMTAAFSSKIDQLGGRIIAQSWYYGEAQDFSRQFKAIREAAFHFDSTDVEKIIEEAEAKGEFIDEHEIPVLSIDAIFLPVYSEQIQYVAPQFAFANIRAQILGGEYWDDLDALTMRQVETHVNGCIFVSDYFPDENSLEFRDFRTQFRLRMRKTPERWEVFGYDAFQLIVNAVKAGAKSGPGVSDNLNSLNNYPGIKGRISFKGNDRVNNEVNFLQFINGRIIKHQLSD